MDSQIDRKLAPYLSNLNGTNFREEFEKFADLILSSSSGCEESDYDSSSCSSNEPLVFAESHSPAALGGATSPAYYQNQCFSAACSPLGASSSANFSYYPSSTTASCSSSCSPSSWPTSGASSTCDYDSEVSCELTVASSKVKSRKHRNATAAERYRRKLKGHRSNLDRQLEAEEERNIRLRRQIKSKLELYSEFVALLALNTTRADVRLAALGSASLQQVLENVLAQDARLGAEQRAVELNAHLAHFKRIQLEPSY